MGHLPDMDNGLVGKAGRSNSNYPRAIARKKSSKVGSMTTAGINSTPTEVAAPAPTAQITNNEISFVLKASPAAPEKQAASVLSTQNRIEQKYKFAKITPYSYSPEDFFFTDSYSILLSKYGILWKARRQSVNPCSVRKSCPNGESAAWEHGRGTDRNSTRHIEYLSHRIRKDLYSAGTTKSNALPIQSIARFPTGKR